MIVSDGMTDCIYNDDDGGDDDDGDDDDGDDDIPEGLL